MEKIKEIADRADMIVNGYAFTRENDQIRILNLNEMYLKWAEYSKNSFYRGE